MVRNSSKLGENEKKQGKLILDAFDKALKSGSWDETAFISAAGNKLKTLRDGLSNVLQLDSSLASGASLSHVASPGAGQDERFEVYILIYNSFGDEMRKWELQIASLQNQLSSRPIYRKKHDVEAMIRSKVTPITEGYIVVNIKPDDILQTKDETPYDALKHELTLLKDGSVTPENIVEFVHISGVYQLSEGHLVKIEEGKDV